MARSRRMATSCIQAREEQQMAADQESRKENISAERIQGAPNTREARYGAIRPKGGFGRPDCLAGGIRFHCELSPALRNSDVADDIPSLICGGLQARPAGVSLQSTWQPLDRSRPEAGSAYDSACKPAPPAFSTQR